MRYLWLGLALTLGCGSTTTLPDDDTPPADAGGDTDGGAEALRAGVIYDACGPADGPAIAGFLSAGSPICDGSRTTTATPRLEIYAAGTGPTWSVTDDFATFRHCWSDGRCEDATSGTLTLDPPMGSRTTVQVDLVFPSLSIEESFIVELCEDDVLCG